MSFDPRSKGLGQRPRAPHYDAPRTGILPEEEVGAEDQRVQQLVQERSANVVRMQESPCSSCTYAIFYRQIVNGPLTCVCELSGRQMTPIAWCSRFVKETKKG